MMGLPPDVFKRLSRLNREQLSDQVTTGDCLKTPTSPDETADVSKPTLEDLIPGRERRAGGGRFYEVRRRADQVQPSAVGADTDEPVEGVGLVERYRHLLYGTGAPAVHEVSETLQPVLKAKSRRLAYLDIETCGLAGEPLFLIGLMRMEAGRLRVSQLLARDYSEERAILQAFWKEVAGAECLVTFNGKAFDVPTIRVRSAAAGLFDLPPLPAHVDLLHEARRRWKGQLPNCRLQTLEQWVCLRRRVGDIPGRDIPAAYHDFVQARQGDDPARRNRSLQRLQVIIHHNALDLVTMAELVTHLLTPVA
jgi:uncharacterized protein YprB with RNaseH-like and TPR domain